MQPLIGNPPLQFRKILAEPGKLPRVSPPEIVDHLPKRLRFVLQNVKGIAHKQQLSEPGPGRQAAI
jgi:hypothetical protein